MALLESNFENRLSFVEESRFFLHNHVWGKKASSAKTCKAKSELFFGSPMKGGSKMELQRELRYGEPFWLSFFLSVDVKESGLIKFVWWSQ